MLIYHGDILEDQLKKESVSYNDLYMALRQQGIASVSDVRYAILELDGSISVIQNSAGHPESREDCVTAAILEASPVNAVEMHLQAAGVSPAPNGSHKEPQTNYG